MTGVLFLQSQTFFGADSKLHHLLARHLDRERFEVHVACAPGRPSGSAEPFRAYAGIEDVALRPVNFGPSLFGKGYRESATALARGAPALIDLPQLVRYARRNDIGIVHATEKPRDALTAVTLARLTGAKAVIHMHVKRHEALTGPARFALTHTDGLIAISRFVARSLTDAGIPGERVHIAPNAIDMDDWAPMDRAAARHALGLPHEERVLACVSRLFRWKGHVDLLRAMAATRRTHPGTRLLVAGSDDPRAHPGGGSFSAELHALATELGIADAVTFLGETPRVREILAACDVFAMPSFEEPFGMVYLEAMAMERPVVGLNNGGTPEVVRDGDCGLLSDPGDIDGLAANLGRLLAEPCLRETMGRAGRERVSRLFRPERMAADVSAVYEQLLRPGRPAVAIAAGRASSDDPPQSGS